MRPAAAQTRSPSSRSTTPATGRHLPVSRWSANSCDSSWIEPGKGGYRTVVVTLGLVLQALCRWGVRTASPPARPTEEILEGHPEGTRPLRASPLRTTTTVVLRHLFHSSASSRDPCANLWGALPQRGARGAGYLAARHRVPVLEFGKPTDKPDAPPD